MRMLSEEELFSKWIRDELALAFSFDIGGVSYTYTQKKRERQYEKENLRACHVHITTNIIEEIGQILLKCIKKMKKQKKCV